MEFDDLHTEDDVREVNDEIQFGKSAGPDDIAPEVFKAGGQPLIQKLTEFHVLRGWLLTKDLKDARIVHPCKDKDDKSSFYNYRGIFLSALQARSSPRSSLIC